MYKNWPLLVAALQTACYSTVLFSAVLCGLGHNLLMPVFLLVSDLLVAILQEPEKDSDADNEDRSESESESSSSDSSDDGTVYIKYSYSFPFSGYVIRNAQQIYEGASSYTVFEC